MAITKKSDEQSAAAQAGLDAARRLLADPKFINQLGNRRVEFQRLIWELEQTLKRYDDEAGIIKSDSFNATVVMGTATTTFNPYVIAAGLFAAAILGPTFGQTIKHAQTQRALESAAGKLRDFIKATGWAIVRSPLYGAAEAGAVAAILAAYQLQQVSLQLLSAATLEKALGVAAGTLVVPTKEALDLIRDGIADLLLRMPPGCKDLATDYKNHLARANNVVRGIGSTGNTTKIWKAFLEAAAKLVACITGSNGPGGPTPTGS